MRSVTGIVSGAPHADPPLQLLWSDHQTARVGREGTDGDKTLQLRASSEGKVEASPPPSTVSGRSAFFFFFFFFFAEATQQPGRHLKQIKGESWLLVVYVDHAFNPATGPARTRGAPSQRTAQEAEQLSCVAIASAAKPRRCCEQPGPTKSGNLLDARSEGGTRWTR